MDTSSNPRSGVVNTTVEETPAGAVVDALEAAHNAAPLVANTAPAVRRLWLHAIADALERRDSAAELVALADSETALGVARLDGELHRAADQLRFYGDVAATGRFLDAVIEGRPGAMPVLSRVCRPLGPVAVFGASNFPFGFGVLGHDTASALAAGCPVIAKAHPAHPVLSRQLAVLASSALLEAGGPAGCFGLVAGFEAGTMLVSSPLTSAVAFTGSQSGGLALWRLANAREQVIPVFAEMGTVNPVVVTPRAVSQIQEIAAGLISSFTLGTGQFCTKPGLVLAPAGSGLALLVSEALREAAPQGWALTEQISLSQAAGVDDLIGAGASMVARVPGPRSGFSMDSSVLSANLDDLRPGSRLLQECFGPVVVIAEYTNRQHLFDALDRLPGCLAGSVMSSDADPDVADLVSAITRFAGRVVVNGWPTGVRTSWSQHHGGPWPATTVPSSTSVGAGALTRFVRPIAYQDVPDSALPPPLQSGNPWRVARRINGILEEPRDDITT